MGFQIPTYSWKLLVSCQAFFWIFTPVRCPRRTFRMLLVVASTQWFLWTIIWALAAAFILDWMVAFGVDFFLQLIWFVVVISLYWKTPNFYDVWFIQGEQRWFVWLFLAGAFARSIIPRVIVANLKGWRAQDMCTVSLAMIMVPTMCLTLTALVIHKGKKAGYCKEDRYDAMGRTPSMSGQSMTASSMAGAIGSVLSPRRQAAEGKKFKLKQLLRHKKSLDMFAYHLVREFSIECLVSIIEFSQLKEAFLSNEEFMGNVTQADQGDDLTKGMIKFPEEVPKSDLVWGPLSSISRNDLENDDSTRLKEFKLRVWTLYDRYIVDGGDLEINISYGEFLYDFRKNLHFRLSIGMRNRFKARMKDRKAWISGETTHDELFSIFDKPTKIMMKLMNDAYMRFVNTEECRRVEKFLEDKAKEEVVTSTSPRVERKGFFTSVGDE